MSCGVGRRHGTDPALLWLWCRVAATALIRPLVWELPCAANMALKRPKKKKKQLLSYGRQCGSLCILLSPQHFNSSLTTALGGKHGQALTPLPRILIRSWCTFSLSQVNMSSAGIPNSGEREHLPFTDMLSLF